MSERPGSPSLRARARRHRLLADPTRLTIIEALREAPREIAELARLTGVHLNTVRSHLRRLEEAGLVEWETAPRTGPGRPARRYRLRERLLRERLTSGGGGFKLLVEGLVRLVRGGQDDDGEVERAARREGARLGERLGRRLDYPTGEQVLREVTALLEQLEFAPSARRDGDHIEIELRACPFWGGLAEDHGEVICAFHLGLLRGLVRATTGTPIQVSLEPFTRPDRCRVDIDLDGLQP